MSDKKIKPLVKKNFNLSAYKAINKLDDGVKDKELEWIQLSPAFYKATGINMPKGVVSILRGFSNTGKSTALLETAIGCQRQGILPIIIDTENGWNWQHARDAGFEYEEIVDQSTGEIVNYDGFFIYINNDHLINSFGKKRAGKDREEATVEDVAEFCHKVLDDQMKGDLDCEVCFLWDSVGTLNCDKSVESQSSNNQWNAGAMESSFKSLLNARIPGSRKENKKYTNTFVAVNKIWLDNMAGAGVIKHKGGEAVYYASRVIVHFGGIISHASKKLFAKADGKDYCYGTQTKVMVDKNHVNGASFKGELVSTAHGFILPEDIEQYKKEHKKFILGKLNISGNADLTFEETESFEIDMTGN